MKKQLMLMLIGISLLLLGQWSVQASSVQELDVSSLAGTWENSIGGRYEISETGEIRVYFDGEYNSTLQFSKRTLSSTKGYYFEQLIELDKKWINGAGFVYVPAGKTYGNRDSSQHDKDRMIISGQGGYFEGNPEHIFYRVGEKPQILWTFKKEMALSDFIRSWSKEMGQDNYKNLGQHDSLMWQGSVLDAEFSKDGQSDAQYTIVAAYSYDRGGGLSHTYHFAILPDGSTTVIYSEKRLVYAGTRTGFDGYEVSKLNTGNADLRKGFADIVGS